MKRLSLASMIKAVEGHLIGDPSAFKGPIQRVIIDSRQVMAGDLYVPIIGERFDGHKFINNAYDNGATLVFTDRQIDLSEGQVAVRVEDTKLALGQLAAYYRSLFEIPVIGITGSVGKTSTKEMLASILSTKFNVHKTSGNYNNDIGLPLTLLQLEPAHEIAVVEMGMNHFGEIDSLARILKPTIGLITNIGVSHIEFLGSKEGILKAKLEMLPHIKDHGTLVLNGDDELLVDVTETFGASRMLYGASKGFDATMIGHQLTDEGGQKMTVSSNQGIYNITVDYPGEHILHNALGGLLIGEILGLSKECIIEGVKSYKPAEMRLNAYHLTHDITLLDDAYNASVDSMSSALKTLESMKQQKAKTVAILGSMFEMGDYAKTGHQDVGAEAVSYQPDVLLTVGEEAAWIGEGAIQAGYPLTHYHHFLNQEALIKDVLTYIESSTVVLLKASRGMQLEKTRDYIIESFEEQS